MENTPPGADVNRKQNINDYLANERTMLAWVRTGIGIMAFGFAVVKFSIFVRQVSVAVGAAAAPPQGHSAQIGMALVILGTLSILFAYMRYRQTERQLNTGEYFHSSVLIQLLVVLMAIIGIALLAYLITTT